MQVPEPEAFLGKEIQLRPSPGPLGQDAGTYFAYCPPCECADCQQSWHTMADQEWDRYTYMRAPDDFKGLTVEEVKTTIASLVEAAHQDRVFLQTQIESQGDRNRSRWRKLSRDNRDTVLSQVDPDMQQNRWDYVQYIYHNGDDDLGREHQQHMRGTILMPYLGKDQLKSDPGMLLSLLHNRTHHAPEEWAMFDARQMQLRWEFGLLDTRGFSATCVVMHGTQYGRIVGFDREATHRCDQFGFPRARLILDAQARLLKFLRSVAVQLLEGTELGNLGFQRFWHWMDIDDELQNLKHWRDQYSDQILAGQPLPVEYDRAIGSLETILVNRMHDESAHIRLIFRTRPGFRHNWKLQRNDGVGLSIDPKEQDDEEELNSYMARLMEEDPLDWFLRKITAGVDSTNRIGFASLFAFLDEHLAKCSASDRARLDEVLLAKLSGLAALSELLDTMRLHRPRASDPDGEAMLKTENRRWWRRLAKTEEQGKAERCPRTARLLKAFIEIPAPRRGQNDQLVRFDATHESLQALWKSIESLCGKQLWKLKTLTPDEIKHDLDAVSAYASQEHLNNVAHQRQRMAAEVARLEAPVVTSFGTSQTQTPPQNAPKTEVKAKRKKKTKARPEHTSAITSDLGDIELIFAPSKPVSSEAMEKIPTTQRALGMVTAMYPTSPEEAKSMDWDVLVHAMRDMGFAARNIGGSAVSLEPFNGMAAAHGGKIIFHRPHPVAKVDPIMAQALGRRMARRFGWQRHMFVLAEKKM
ncbi:Uu.00g002710.m01.CDS01 [Anthostomella pinea]|uniref:Uu.00g002710.m01.CDS01 n=1 Tax=Anthostomella pinea TaxID=933095 RepID=A0AAI8VJL2_9PEZI|nr:Uu.00g002710.m01.CDS01 [Anthostomella pinea]